MENPNVYTGPERRKYKRVSFWTLARYKEIKKDIESKNAQVENISEGGLLLKTKDELSLSNPLEIELYIPYIKGYHLIKTKARPVWHRQTDAKDFWHTGVEFQYADPESKKILAEFIRYFENKALTPYGYISQESYLHIPYWCIVQQIEIPKEQFLGNPQVENFYHVIFESKKNLFLRSQIELELKIPIIKMPFKVRGTVVESKEIKKNTEYSILLKLTNLSKDQLEFIKKFAKE